MCIKRWFWLGKSIFFIWKYLLWVDSKAPKKWEMEGRTGNSAVKNSWFSYWNIEENQLEFVQMKHIIAWLPNYGFFPPFSVHDGFSSFFLRTKSNRHFKTCSSSKTGLVWFSDSIRAIDLQMNGCDRKTVLLSSCNWRCFSFQLCVS